MLATILGVLKSGFWLLVRWFMRRDANEAQREIEKGRQHAMDGDDAADNADLQRARDRLLDPKSHAGRQ